jgi:hypothetical protein
LVALALSIIELLLLVPPAFGVSSHASIIRRVSWAHGEHTTDRKKRLFVGLSASSEYGGDHLLRTFHFSTDKCEDFASEANIGKCETCVAVANSLQFAAIFTLLPQLGQITTDVQRSTRAGDVNCQKVWGIVTGIVGFASAVFSLSGFRYACWDIADNHTMLYTMYPGPGWILTFIVVVLKNYDLVLHVAMPVPLAVSEVARYERAVATSAVPSQTPPPTRPDESKAAASRGTWHVNRARPSRQRTQPIRKQPIAYIVVFMVCLLAVQLYADTRE